MAHAGGNSAGSFRHDLDWLLEELGKPPIMELGKPAPAEKYLPQRTAADCPATHNRALIDRKADTAGADAPASRPLWEPGDAARVNDLLVFTVQVRRRR